MEGVILDPEVFTTPIAMGALIILGLVAAAIFFGSMAERERHGEVLHWAADPLPGTEEETAPPAGETRYPKAA